MARRKWGSRRMYLRMIAEELASCHCEDDPDVKEGLRLLYEAQLSAAHLQAVWYLLWAYGSAMRR